MLGLRIICAADAFGGVGEVVGCVAELNIWAEQEPVGAGFAEGHSNAAGIYDAGVADAAIKLYVGVAADDYCGVEFFKERHEAVVWR